MEILTLNPISSVLLLAIGILLVAVEVLTFTFILFWFGIAAIIVAGISYIYNFSNGEWQIATIGTIALLLLLTLRSKALKIFLKSKDGDIKDTFLNVPGYGIVKNGKIYYKATYWNCDDIDLLKEGEKVKILEAKQNNVKVKKI